MSQGTLPAHIQGQEKRNTLLLYARKSHKSLMAIMGVQLFIWSCTGFYMVLSSIHYIHGDHLVASESPSLYSQNLNVSFADVLNLYPNAIDLRLAWLGPRAVYRFRQQINTGNSFQTFILDANTAELLPPLSKAQARALVLHLLASDYTNMPIRSITLLTNSVPSEISTRGLPLWQIELDTWDNTRLYVSQNSGELVSVRHHAWRLFDLFWRLHIMDYTEGEDISNTLLMLSGLLAFLAALAGLIMLFFRVFISKEPSSAKQALDLGHTKTSRSLSLYAKYFHKWLALFVFIQLFIWVVSGFLVGRLDANIASGRNTLQATPIFKNSDSLLSATGAHNDLVSIDNSFAQLGPAQEIALERLHKQWVFQIKHSAGRHDYWPSHYTLLDAFSGQVLTVNQALAEAIAVASYKTAAGQTAPNIIHTELLDRAGSTLAKEQNAVWKITINDNFDTQIFIRASTGKVIKHHNAISEWKRLLLKLHFMDYANEGSFNNYFSKIWASITLLLCLSGLLWLFQLIKEGQLSLARFKSSTRKGHLVSIDNEPSIALNPNDTLLDALLEQNFAIASSCAGGGMCGKCLCVVSESLKPTHAETTLLSDQQLNENWRLSCQHRVKMVSKIWLDNKT